MARIARFVVPGLPPAFRGARRERVFFGEDDDALYRDLLASQCRRDGAWRSFAYCLTPNPRSSHSRPRPNGGARARPRQGVPPLRVGHQRAGSGVTGHEGREADRMEGPSGQGIDQEAIDRWIAAHPQ
jgi:hypothetical protein